MAITWSAEKRGIVLNLSVQPAGRKNEIRGEHAGALKVVVTAQPENGKANEAVIELLAKVWCLRKSQLSICSGETSRQKKLLITGITADELMSKLELTS